MCESGTSSTPIKLKAIFPADQGGGTGLLDGGATHPLRQGTPAELAAAVKAKVELAHGVADLFQNPSTRPRVLFCHPPQWNR